MAFLARRGGADFLRGCEAVARGSLRVRTPEGAVHDFGSSAPEAEIRIRNWSAVAFASPGEIISGRTYAAGLWDTPSIEDLATVALLNADRLGGRAHASFWAKLRLDATEGGARAHARRAETRENRALAAAGNEFFMLWLDPGMTYSTALFTPHDDDLHRAQDRKNDRILDMLGQGTRILDIGCGWGGLAERAADRGHQVTGLTTSAHQKGYADARLDGRADIRLEDHRKTRGSFDGIAAIEVDQTGGGSRIAAVLATIKQRLSATGCAVLQTRIAPEIPGAVSPPGIDRGPLSAASLASEIGRAGLTVSDRFAFGEHCAATWRAWGARLDARAGRAVHMGFDAAFLRHWRFRFGLRAADHATGGADVVQLKLTHA